MSFLSEQIQFQHFAALTLCVGALGDLALHVYGEKLPIDRALRYMSAAVMAVFAAIIGTGHWSGFVFASLVLCMSCVQVPLFIRTRRALRASKPDDPRA